LAPVRGGPPEESSVGPASSLVVRWGAGGESAASAGSLTVVLALSSVPILSIAARLQTPPRRATVPAVPPVRRMPGR